MRHLTATSDGQTYQIPEMWAIGYCTTHGGDTGNAVRAWAEQATIEAKVDYHYITSETAYGRTVPLSFPIRCF